MTRNRHPEWRDYQEPTKYPFSDTATLANDAGVFLLPETFLDAAFYVVGATYGGFLRKIVVTSQTVTIFVGDNDTDELAYGQFDLSDPPSELRFADLFGRPAGVLVSEPSRMAVFQAWAQGTHVFERDQSGIVAACWMPMPDTGIRGFKLDDGSVLTGDVYLVGDRGIILSCDEVVIDAGCDTPNATHYVVRVDVVGDPLWRQDNCIASGYVPRRFVETIVFQQGLRQVEVAPGDYGDVKIVAGNRLAGSTILRVRPRANGIHIELVGERLASL